jgi:AraC family transcriptional regulator
MMLRSFDLLKGITPAQALLAADEESAALLGGGSGYAMPWHWHDCLMLLLPSIGVLDLRYETRREGVWMSRDRFAAVPAGHAHETVALREGQAHLALYVTDVAIRRVEAELGSLHRVRRQLAASALFPITPEIRGLQALCSEDGGDTLGEAAVRARLAGALLIRCLAAMERGQPLPTATRRGHAAALVDEAKAFVAQRLQDDIALNVLADRLGVSRRHLTRLFREQVGLSIGAFQQAKRLDAAKELLTRTDLVVDEVAYRVGFDSGSALARALRRRDGHSPRDVRKQSLAGTARRSDHRARSVARAKSARSILT